MCFLKTYKPLKLFAMKTYVVNMHNLHCNSLNTDITVELYNNLLHKRINTHFRLSISKSFNDLEEAALVVLSNTYNGSILRRIYEDCHCFGLYSTFAKPIDARH